MKWLLYIAAGSGAVAGLAWLCRPRSSEPDRPKPRPRPVHQAPAGLHFEMVWPVPEYRGRMPTISSGHRSDNPSRPTHKGVDIMYRRQRGDTQRAGGDGAGSKRHIMPKGIQAIAAGPGRISKA